MSAAGLASGMALALAIALPGPASATDSMPTQPMTRPRSEGPQAKALEAFIAKRKFEPTVFNPVQRSEGDRARLQALIDALGMRLLPLADGPPNEPRVLAEFLHSMAAIDAIESEDKAQAAGYMEELMDILGIASSHGLLNNWVYGFDPADVKNPDGVR